MQVPNEPEAERAILGSVLIDPRLFHELDISSNDFYIHRHRMIWDTFTSVVRSGRDIDYSTVTTALSESDLLHEVGGYGAVTDLMGAVASILHVDSYVKTVKEEG